MSTCTCHYCQKTLDLDVAVEEGWVPYFYDGEIEISEPVCPACAEGRIRFDADGEYELIPSV